MIVEFHDLETVVDSLYDKWNDAGGEAVADEAIIRNDSIIKDERFLWKRVGFMAGARYMYRLMKKIESIEDVEAIGFLTHENI